MQNQKVRILSYDEKRDVTFVFGAGTSKAAGIPMQNELLPYLFEQHYGEVCRHPTAATAARFISENFNLSPIESIYPSLESVFGFIDYFLARSENLSREYDVTKLRKIRETLKDIIHWLISKSKIDLSFHKSFWKNVTAITKNFSVVTLNYDTTLDESFDSIYADTGYIDYCIHLLNYENVLGIDAFNWWINPRLPVPISDSTDNPRPIKLLKMHGSLNWKFCACCNEVLLTPWDSEISLDTPKYKKVKNYPTRKNPNYEYTPHNCPICESSFQTLITPPSHIKDFSNPISTKLLQECQRELRAARRIVFVGYSFPDADIHLKGLFSRITPQTPIRVVNPWLTKSSENTFKSLSSDVIFMNHKFEDLASNTSLLNEVLGEKM